MKYGSAMLSKYLIFCFLIVGAWAAEENVFEWTDKDFNKNLKKHEHTLVMFYSKGCSHCESLKPEYAEAANLLKEANSPIILAKINCWQVGRNACRDNGVNAYPTLKIFNKDKFVEEYDGPSKAAKIVEFVQSRFVEVFGSYRDYHPGGDGNIFSEIRINPRATLASIHDGPDEWDIREKPINEVQPITNEFAPEISSRVPTTTPAPSSWTKLGKRISSTYVKVKDKAKDIFGK